MKTSDQAGELGLYASDCCGEELIFDDGDTFFRCPSCHKLCEWEFVETVVSYEAFERDGREAA